MGSVSVPVSVTKKWGGGGGEIRKNIGKRWSGEGQKEDGGKCQGSRAVASALSCLRSQHPARLCWECEAGGLWGQQAPANHLHVRHGHALSHWHSLLDEPRGDQR